MRHHGVRRGTRHRTNVHLLQWSSVKSAARSEAQIPHGPGMASRQQQCKQAPGQVLPLSGGPLPSLYRGFPVRTGYAHPSTCGGVAELGRCMPRQGTWRSSLWQRAERVGLRIEDVGLEIE